MAATFGIGRRNQCRKALLPVRRDPCQRRPELFLQRDAGTMTGE